jgi:solute carrier family 35 (UDP-sugar transporter), member A1/2/3
MSLSMSMSLCLSLLLLPLCCCLFRSPISLHSPRLLNLYPHVSLAPSSLSPSVLFSAASSPHCDSADLRNKALAMGALVLQTTGLTVTMRLSRLKKLPYVTSTAVLLSEILKLAVSLILRWREERVDSIHPHNSLLGLFTARNDIAFISFTSGLYVLQNNLQYIAISALPAVVYQVFAQLKILSAAIFSYFLQQRRLTAVQYFALLLLTMGTVLVQISAHTMKDAMNINMQIGIVAVALSCITSALGGVTQEITLKNGKLSLWERNTQICTISLVFALLGAIKDYPTIVQQGFFHGYTPLVFGVVLLHALGGLLVSIVVKQTNSVVKGFASSGAILLSSLFSLFILKEISLSAGLVAGTMLVALASLAYARKTDLLPKR